jgi:hypothetical protein
MLHTTQNTLGARIANESQQKKAALMYWNSTRQQLRYTITERIMIMKFILNNLNANPQQEAMHIDAFLENIRLQYVPNVHLAWLWVLDTQEAERRTCAQMSADAVNALSDIHL